MNTKKDTLIKRAYRRGFEYEQQFHGCAPAIIAALIDVELVNGEDDLIKAAGGLSGGMGLSGIGNCGAFTGGSMVLSYLHGIDLQAFKEGHRRTDVYNSVYTLFRRFKDIYGSCICRDIQKRIFGRSFDLRDPSDKQKFREMGAHKDKCPEVVGNAAMWTAEIILEQGIPK